MTWRRIARRTCGVALLTTVGLWLFSINRLWTVECGPFGTRNKTSWPGSLSLSYTVAATQRPFTVTSKDMPWSTIRLLPWTCVCFRNWPVTPGSKYVVFLPFWVLAIIPPLGFILLRPKRRLPHGCRKCDYDLTGNVSGICPECGTGIISKES